MGKRSGTPCGGASAALQEIDRGNARFATWLIRALIGKYRINRASNGLKGGVDGRTQEARIKAGRSRRTTPKKKR
jgi:hypothetical protein